MPSASTLYRHANPEYVQKEKEYVKQYIVKKYNEDPECKERVKARNLAYYYKKKQEIESKHTNDDDVEYY